MSTAAKIAEEEKKAQKQVAEEDLPKKEPPKQPSVFQKLGHSYYARQRAARLSSYKR